MTQSTIEPGDVFIVSPGYSVVTANRDMAHAGGKITLADIRTEDPAKTMAGFVKTGRVKLDEASRDLRKEMEAKAETARKKVAETARKRQEAKAKEAEEAKAKEAEEAKAKEAEEAKAKEAEEAKEPPTLQEEIIEAIGKLDKNNPEQWTPSSGKPLVSALEVILKKQISAADRDAAWSKIEA